jgi:hypothetical protein
MKFLKYDLKNVGIFGDVHAALGNLTNILTLIDVANRSKVISLGDIWDRGIEPNEVINVIHDLYKADKLLPILGNHELKFLRHFTEPKSKVVMGSQQTATLNLLTQESKDKFVDLYKDEIVCIYDPNMKIFISHAPGGRPARILYKNYENCRVVIGGEPNMTFEEFLQKDNHIIAKKHISTLMYGITNGDKTSEGLPVRLPIVNDENDDLDGWTYIYGHIHAGNFHPELSKKCICLDFCSPTGVIGGAIVNSQEDIRLFV